MSNPTNLKFSFIGAGRMNRALMQGLLKSGKCAPADLVVTNRTAKKSAALAAELGVEVAENNAMAANRGAVVVLGVKPLDAAEAIHSCAAELSGKLVISVMSGLSLASLQAMVGNEARLVRAMPNVGALAGVGATALAFGDRTTAADQAAALTLFEAAGKAYVVKESLLDAVTGLSGSGPAYVYLVIEALADGGVKAGLPRDLALQLAIQTLRGSAQLAEETQLHPALLREMVTSPGGTTAAALAVLEDRGVRGAFIAAVETATKRAAELGAVSTK